MSKLGDELEMELKKAERSRLMLDCSPLACFLLTKDFEVLDCNNEALSLFTVEGFEDGIAAFRDIFYNDVVIMQHFDSALQNGYERFEWDFNDRDDWQMPCEIAFIRSNLGDEAVVAAYIQDIRVLRELLESDINLLVETIEEKRRAEISEENNQSKSRFLAKMSHEIRTPISAVMGISEIQLQNSELPPDIEDAFAKIYNSADTLLGLVNDILDLSKIEAGKMSLTPAKYETASLINDVIQLCLFYQEDKDIKLVVNADENIPAHLIGDDLRIKQILTNLLSNAFKYTEQGSVTLTMYALTTQEDGSTSLVINIRDTGRGMSKEQLAALSEEYVRFHEQEARNVKGTGLGMTITHSLIDLMEADIDIESAVGKGTSVTLLIPQKTSGDELLGIEAAKGLENYRTPRLTAKRLAFAHEPMPYGKVLVVDDIDTNLYVAKGLLGLYKLQIETCTSGRDAIEKVEGGAEFDIIFMDDMMPDLTGTETVKILRQMGYDHPIVAFTANALVGQEEEYLRSGFSGFISKPIQTVRLDALLKKFIKDKQSQEVLEEAKKMQSASTIPDEFMLDPETEKRVRADFIETQTNIISEINDVMSKKDLKTAYRLAHTLKGYAAMLNEQSLVDASAEMEAIFKKGEIPEKSIFDSLENELAKTLDAISN